MHRWLVLFLCSTHITIWNIVQKGDTCLHIAMRTRNRRMLECILKNPRNSRYLYVRNKDGETAYSIDNSQRKSILSHIFGASKFSTWSAFIVYTMLHKSDPKLLFQIIIYLVSVLLCSDKVYDWSQLDLVWTFGQHLSFSLLPKMKRNHKSKFITTMNLCNSTFLPEEKCYLGQWAYLTAESLNGKNKLL